MKVQWLDLKSFVNARSLSIQWIEFTDKYYLLAIDGGFQLECELLKNPSDTTDLNDFVNNYKTLGNKRLDPRDSDGSALSRAKITTTGWHFQAQGLKFETSQLNSLYSKKPDNTDYNFSIIKFYKNVSGVEVEIIGADLNQTFLDVNCIKTVVDWEPTHDMELIGGSLKQKTIPTQDIHFWIVGVPDVAEEYGGSKPFVVNVDLAYIGLEDGISVDGRVPKYMTYSATYHTTKLRLIFRHLAGFKHKLHFVFELFKA